MTRCGFAILGNIKRAFIVKARGGIDEAGDKWKRSRRAARDHGETLRDTGLLLNSLSPGVVSSEQIFRVGRGEVIIGTNRKGAMAHHMGTKHLPQRRLWPDPKDWPNAWWDDIMDQARQGLLDLAVQMVRNAQ